MEHLPHDSGCIIKVTCFACSLGLGTEALSIIISLVQTKQLRAEDILITQSGDDTSEAVIDAMDPSIRRFIKQRQHPQVFADEWSPGFTFSQFKAQRLQQQLEKDGQHEQQKNQSAREQAAVEQEKRRPAIAVCHNWFECWRMNGTLPSSVVGCPCPLNETQVRVMPLNATSDPNHRHSGIRPWVP